MINEKLVRLERQMEYLGTISHTSDYLLLLLQKPQLKLQTRQMSKPIVEVQITSSLQLQIIFHFTVYTIQALFAPKQLNL